MNLIDFALGALAVLAGIVSYHLLNRRRPPAEPVLPPGVTKEVRPDGTVVFRAEGGAGGRGGMGPGGRGEDGQPGAGPYGGAGGRGGSWTRP